MNHIITACYATVAIAFSIEAAIRMFTRPDWTVLGLTLGAGAAAILAVNQYEKPE